MASMEQFLADSRNFLADVEKELPNLVTEAGITAASLIQNRVQETGANAEGGQLGEYTDGVYKSKRQKRGLPTGFVNLTFTGQMWQDVKIIQVFSNGPVATATIGAQFKENDDKLFHNSVRYKNDILEVSQQEEEELAVITDDGLQAIVDKNFST